MRIKTLFASALAAVAVGGLSLMPAEAPAQGNGKSKAKGHSKSHWNPNPPKKNGRHDNRNYNKDNDRWDDDDRDDRRRYEDRRRAEERRRLEERRRAEARRRELERRRWEEARRRQDAYRRYDDNRYRTSNSRYYEPYYSSRDSWAQREADRRQRTKNEWRNIAIASGALAVIGLLNDDKTLTFVGAAGALYSLHRYEQDRKSQNRLDNLRYSYFSQPYFYRDGRRYDRRTVVRNGQRYYQFVRR